MQTFKVIFKHVQFFFIHDKEKGGKDILVSWRFKE